MKRLLFFINPNAGHAEIRGTLMEVLEIFWFETAKGDLLSERAADLEDALREKYPMELTLENAAIFDVQAEDRAAANAAAEEAAQSETASDEAGDTQEAAAEGTQEAANE